MDLKSSRKLYHLPLSVLKDALKSSDGNKVLLLEKLEHYATLYAKKRYDHYTPQIPVFGTAVENQKLAIVQLLVETPMTASLPDFLDFANALAELAVTENDLMSPDYNLAPASAMYGESVILKGVKKIDFGSIPFGVYNHRGKFVSYASFKPISTGTTSVISKLAHMIALNAAAYYDSYFEYCDLLRTQRYKAFPSFAEFLVNKTLLFDNNEFFLPQLGRKLLLIKEYIEKYEKLICQSYSLPDINLIIDDLQVYKKLY